MKSTHIAALALFAGLWLIIGAIVDHSRTRGCEVECRCVGIGETNEH